MRRFRAVALCALISAAAGACGARESSVAATDAAYPEMAGAPPPPPPPAPAMVSADAAAQRVQPGVVQVDQEAPGGGAGGGAGPAPARQIAYSHMLGFAVPTASLEALLGAHKSACESAGPATCYVVASDVSGLGEDHSSGTLTLRATPNWVKAFRAGLPAGLKPFNATLDSSNDSSEDLTIQLIDTEARLRSAKTLRDRLNKLLAERPGKLSDLLEIEQTLARVQAEIDSTESILAAMRLRVEMSSVTLSYRAKYSAVSESVWRPLSDSVSGFVPNLVGAVSAIVTFVAVLLPWALLALAAVWGLRRFWMLRSRRRAAGTPAARANP